MVSPDEAALDEGADVFRVDAAEEAALGKAFWMIDEAPDSAAGDCRADSFSSATGHGMNVER